MLSLGTLFVPAVPIIVEAREHCAELARTRRVITAVAIFATAICAIAWNYTANKASRAKRIDD
jgi:hypothetical protein